MLVLMENRIFSKKIILFDMSIKKMQENSEEEEKKFMWEKMSKKNKCSRIKMFRFKNKIVHQMLQRANRKQLNKYLKKIRQKDFNTIVILIGI